MCEIIELIIFFLKKNIEIDIDNKSKMSKELMIEDMENETQTKKGLIDEDDVEYEKPREFQSDPIKVNLRTIDEWKRLNCEIDKKTFKQISKQVEGWHDKGCISEWTDRKNKKHFYLKVKLSKWDLQDCNFKKFNKYIGKDCELQFYANEYDFENDDGKRVCGWTARLVNRSLRLL